MSTIKNMMRANIEDYKYKDIHMVVELDTGGGPNLPYNIWVYKNLEKEIIYSVKNGFQVTISMSDADYEKMKLKMITIAFEKSEEFRNWFIENNVLTHADYKKYCANIFI